MKWQQETISLTHKTNTGFCPNWILQKIFLILENFGAEVSIIYKNTKENWFWHIAEELYYNLDIQQISILQVKYILCPNRTDENLVLFCKMCMQWGWCDSCTKQYTALQKAGRYKRGKSTVRKRHCILLFHQQKVNKWIHSI